MMLKKMLAFCKKAKNISIIFFGEQKFLSDGKMAAFIGEEAEEWKSKDCSIFLELGEAADEQYKLKDGQINENPEINVTDMQRVEELKYSLNMDGTVLKPFMLPDRKIFFVDMARMKVFENEHPKSYFCDKVSENNKYPALVIARNTFPIGYVYPMKINLDTMKHFAQELNIGVEASAKTGFCDAGGQLTIEDV